MVKLDDLLHERRMTLTELAERVGLTLAKLLGQHGSRTLLLKKQLTPPSELRADGKWSAAYSRYKPSAFCTGPNEPQEGRTLEVISPLFWLAPKPKDKAVPEINSRTAFFSV